MIPDEGVGRGWALAAAALLVVLLASFPAALTGEGAYDGAGRLLGVDALYEPPGPLPPNRLRDISTEAAHQPWDAFAFKAFARGEAPLWAPEMGLGAPLLGNGQSAPFSPFKWLTLAPAGGTWTNWFVLGRLAAAGAGMLLLARYLGLSAFAGALGALGFMLHAYFLGHLRFSDVHVYMALPWLLLAAERLRRRPDARGIGLMGLAIGAAGLLGHPEPAIFAAVGAGLAYAAGALADGQARGRVAMALAAAVGLGAGLAAVVVLPFAEFVLQSTSYLFGDRHAFASSLGRMLFDTLVHLITPEGPTAKYESYAGLAPLALAFLGWRHAAARVHALPLLAWGAFCYLVFPPNNVVPTIPLAPNSFYAAPLIACAIAILGAAGLDRLLADPRARIVGAIGLAATALGVGLGAYHLTAPAQPLGDLLPSAVLLVAVGAVLAAQALRAWPREVLGGVLVALTAVDLTWAAHRLVKPLPPFRYPTTPIIAHLKAQPTAERVVSSGNAFVPNTPMMHGVPSLQVMDAFLLRRYIAFYDAVAPAWSPDGFQPDLLDLANVRWLVVARYGLNEPVRKQVAAAPARFPAVVTQARAVLHENRTVLPRARVLHAAEFMPTGWRDAGARLKAAPARWREVALVETPDGKPFPGWTDRPGPASPATITAYGAQHVALAATLDRPGILVLADMYYPGWTAEVDGRPAPVFPVDVAFRGVPLEAGTHQVVFRYRSWPFTLGAVVSGLTLLLGLVMIFKPRRPAPAWMAPSREGAATR